MPNEPLTEAEQELFDSIAYLANRADLSLDDDAFTKQIKAISFSAHKAGRIEQSERDEKLIDAYRTEKGAGFYGDINLMAIKLKEALAEERKKIV